MGIPGSAPAKTGPGMSRVRAGWCCTLPSTTRIAARPGHDRQTGRQTMFTLKIRREVYERQDDTPPTLFDLTEVFVEADEVVANNWVEPERQAKLLADWDGRLDDYTAYTFGGKDGNSFNGPGRLVHVVKGKEERWFLVSVAWLMGPNGQTIERIA